MMGEHREGDITEPYQAGQTIDPTVTEQGETNESDEDAAETNANALETPAVDFDPQNDSNADTAGE